jgi:HSP20 family molecular chaperone IbpA
VPWPKASAGPEPHRFQEVVIMRTFDFSPFFRSTVGFDHLFDMLDQVADAGTSYPPYNI